MSANRLRSRSRPRKRFVGIALALSVAAACAACSRDEPRAQDTPSPARADARDSDRDSEQGHGDAVECRGQGTVADAKVRYGTKILIHAPLRTVYKIQTDVNNWSDWQESMLTSKRLDSGPLRAGSPIRWTSAVAATPASPATKLSVASTIKQVKRNNCIRWAGPANGKGIHISEGTHVWTFTKVKGGTLVRTEESWTGDEVDANVKLFTKALGASLDTGVKELKAAAEARAGR